jgi:hypothetical protein
MSKIWYCVISLLIANLFVEYWRDVPDYLEVAKITWSQMWALLLYYFIWVKE